nr:helix-turn-helix transcriptional regulator [Faecalitalea cylindroides]
MPVGFYGSLQWIGWLSLLDEVALNHWNTQRKAKNISLEKLSELTGISKRHIINIEKGDANASLELVVIIMKQLDISLDNIVFSSILDEDQKLYKEIIIRLMKFPVSDREIIIEMLDVILEKNKLLHQHKTSI